MVRRCVVVGGGAAGLSCASIMEVPFGLDVTHVAFEKLLRSCKDTRVGDVPDSKRKQLRFHRERWVLRRFRPEWRQR